MTIEGGQTEPVSSAELIDSMASSSADLWNEVLERLDAVQEGHTRLSQAVDHLDEVVSNVFAAEPETDLFITQDLSPGEASAEPVADAMTPPSGLSLPAQPDVVRESDEERPARRGRAPEQGAGTEHPWLTEAVATRTADKSLAEQDRPWLAAPVDAGASPVTSARGVSEVEAPERATVVADQSTAEETQVAAELAVPEDVIETEDAQEAVELAAPEDARELGELATPEGDVVEDLQADEPDFVIAAAALDESVEASREEKPGLEPDEDGPWLTGSAAGQVSVTDEAERRHEHEPQAPAAAFDGGVKAEFAPTEGPGPQPGIRVLDPGRVVDVGPEVLDALLAAEFGEVSARLLEPKALTVEALLNEEFAPSDRGTAPSLTPLVPPTAIEADLPPLPSQQLPSPPSAPLPPPPSNLLPPPPKPADTELERPAPLSEAAGEGPESSRGPAVGSMPYVQVSPPPQVVDSPPLQAREVKAPPPPAMPPSGTPEEGPSQRTGDIPPLSFGTPIFTGEPTLPAEPPPIPEPVRGVDTASADDTMTTGGVKTPDEVTSSESTPSDIPPLSFGTPIFTEEPTLASEASPMPPEPPPIPGGVLSPTGRAAEPPDPEAFLTASSMATEILDASPEQAVGEASAEEGAAAAPETPGSNVVSQDFTIISKKHKRFRLR
jgi:hypothetical protein